MFFTNAKRLNDSAGAPITSYSLTSGVAVNSQSIDVSANVGFLSILVTEDAVGGTGDVDIYAQYSVDGTNWYEYYTTASAILTKDAHIVDTLQNATRLITFTARLAPYVRIVLDPDANSRVTLDFIYQEAN